MSDRTRRRYRKKRAKKSGLPPGSLVPVGEPVGPASIARFDYDAAGLREERLPDLAGPLAAREPATVTWINVDNAHQPEVIRRLGELFGLHPLVQEDILNHDQRPKAEEHGECLFVVLKVLDFSDERQELTGEQLSLVLGPGYLLSFQEAHGSDVLEPVRERLRTNRGRLRGAGPDHLAYALLDAVVDHYFVALEKLEDRVEALEDGLLSAPAAGVLPTILQLKRQTFFVRHAVWPLREVIAQIQRGDSGLVSEETRVYLRDVYDHVVQVMDVAEDLRETVAGMLDLYLSTLNMRLNEIIKVLTLFTAIFIPLTFVVGVYGMNFRHMPELLWPWAYPVLWAVMLGLGAGMVWYFRRRCWL